MYIDNNTELDEVYNKPLTNEEIEYINEHIKSVITLDKETATKIYEQKVRAKRVIAAMNQNDLHNTTVEMSKLIAPYFSSEYDQLKKQYAQLKTTVMKIGHEPSTDGIMLLGMFERFYMEPIREILTSITRREITEINTAVGKIIDNTQDEDLVMHNQ